ncbi:MAG TPA: hypothetical protein VFP23_07500 [Solirubrobacterales bacterium]|nr:hypothetical protein [Solirubrobacterales bacterium]
MREIVLYVPAGGHTASADIGRGSVIVGEPGAGADEVEICFEDAIVGQQESMRTLAERASCAARRLLGCDPSTATRIVPREALAAVGTFSLREGRIALSGPDSEGAVAAWLGTLRLDPAELARRPRGSSPSGCVAIRSLD